MEQKLSEHKTYRTRDGSRTGIRVKPCNAPEVRVAYASATQKDWIAGGWNAWGKHNFDSTLDLIEENLAPDPRPFVYADCPMHEDGRRRAVTRDGREVVLLCDDAPGTQPIIGYPRDGNGQRVHQWCANGRLQIDEKNAADLLTPPPPKRVVWVNLYLRNSGSTYAASYDSQQEADSFSSPRLGNRAYPIEID